jgi:hypothetical protein
MPFAKELIAAKLEACFRGESKFEIVLQSWDTAKRRLKQKRDRWIGQYSLR